MKSKVMSKIKKLSMILIIALLTGYVLWAEVYAEPEYTENDRGVLQNEIVQIRANWIPKYYERYCVPKTIDEIQELLNQIDHCDMDSVSLNVLSDYKKALNDAVDRIEYKYDSALPQIYVTTDDGNGNSYGSSLTKGHGDVSARIAVVDVSGNTIVDDNTSVIKIRGNSTAVLAKKPYNIKLGSKVNLFGFGKSKKWVLLADAYDPTLIRNSLALDIAANIDCSSTMGSKRVEVWMDGLYRGAYLLTEKIEEDKNRVNIDSENGDFLIEMDDPSRYEAGNIYFTTDQGSHYRIREPEKEESVENVREKMDDFEAAMDSDYKTAASMLDIDSFVNMYILNEYMATWDYSWLSVYYSKRQNNFRIAH